MHLISCVALHSARRRWVGNKGTPSMASLPIPAASFAFLTFISVLAVCRARGDAGAIAFVASAYVLLVLFFLSLRRLEGTPPTGGSAAKAATWLLAAALNLLFSWRATVLLPLGLSAVVWAVAVTATGAGFYALFCL